MKKELEYIAAGIKEIEEYCKEHKYDYYGDIHEEVSEMANKIREFARGNGIPIILDVDHIINTYHEGESESESESSYYDYEEESSYYDYEEEVYEESSYF